MTGPKFVDKQGHFYTVQQSGAPGAPVFRICVDDQPVAILGPEKNSLILGGATFGAPVAVEDDTRDHNLFQTADAAWEHVFASCKTAKVKLTPVKRDIFAIAGEIRQAWSKVGRGVNYAAKPYLDAMFSLRSVEDMYGLDTGRSVVLYFLANATSYRGALAKAHKEELKAQAEYK